MFVNPTALYQLAKVINEDLREDAEAHRLLRQLRRLNHPTTTHLGMPAPEEAAVERKVS